jgi:hypothetical protein
VGAFLRLLDVVSSSWSTGFDWLSGEDGLTIGFRRYAASTARKVLQMYGLQGTPLLGYIGEQIDQIQDTDTNGWPMSDPYMRAHFLGLSTSENWWMYQITHTIGDWERNIFGRYPDWTNGRLIALAVRARNSGRAYVKNLHPADEGHAYRTLVARYTQDGTREHRMARVRSVERKVGAEEVWR